MTYIKTINGAEMPRYHTKGAAGFDIKANTDKEMSLFPGRSYTIPTGLVPNLDINENIELQIRSRSGMAFKFGLIVANAPGTIDPDFEGEILIRLTHTGEFPYLLKPGDRIAQGVFAKFERPEGIPIDNTTRGDKGFGSTGER